MMIYKEKAVYPNDLRKNIFNNSKKHKFSATITPMPNDDRHSSFNSRQTERNKMAFTLARKITVASINGIRGGFKPVEKGADPVFTARILGKATKVTIEQSPYGEYQKFKGDFIAYDADGQEHRSAVAILPAPVDDMLANALESSGGPVTFAFDIYRVHHDGQLGYQFAVKTLQEAEPIDELRAIINSVPALKIEAKQPDLPAIEGKTATKEKTKA